MAILEYLEEAYPKVPLLPADPHGRARVRSLCGLIVSDTHPLLVPRVGTWLKANAGLDDATLRAWRTHWITRGIAAFETRLARDPATGAFSHGDRVTLADICLMSLIAVAKTVGFQPTNAPTVTRIVEACEAMDAFACANPFRQTGAPSRPQA
jgi:maleylacetoacetate isomerase/maleylpyruvate isomerase